jgi:hypothetical protein
MTEQPEWTSEEKDVIDYWARLDRVSSTIGAYMLFASDLPVETVTRLLPLADFAWRDKDPSGVIVFHDIHSQHPRVEYVEDKSAGDNVRLGFYKLSPDRCVIPLEPIFFLIMNLAKGVQ